VFLREQRDKAAMSSAALDGLFRALDAARCAALCLPMPAGDPVVCATRILKSARVTLSVTGRYWSDETREARADAIRASRERGKVPA